MAAMRALRTTIIFMARFWRKRWPREMSWGCGSLMEKAALARPSRHAEELMGIYSAAVLTRALQAGENDIQLVSVYPRKLVHPILFQ